MTRCYTTAMAIQDMAWTHHFLPMDGRRFPGSGAKGVACIKEAWRQQQQLEGLGLLRCGSSLWGPFFFIFSWDNLGPFVPMEYQWLGCMAHDH